jgi:hypothetical protein
MLSIVISAEGLEQPAVATLAPLVAGAASGLVREVLLVDGTGNGVIERVADVAGCRFVHFRGARGAALDAGARVARSPWLMFLQAGAVLEPGWIDEATHFIQAVGASGKARAGLFRHGRSRYGDRGWRNALRLVGQQLRGPSPDQGLLIRREHYAQLGGFRAGGGSRARLTHPLRRGSRTLLHSRIVMLG